MRALLASALLSLICTLPGCDRSSTSTQSEQESFPSVSSSETEHEFESITPEVVIDPDALISSLGELSVGDGFAYRYLKTRHDNGVESRPSEQVRLHIEVLEKDESGYLMRWQLQMEEFPESDNSYQARFSRIGRTPNLIRVSQDFAQIMLVNKHELYEVGLQTVDLMNEIQQHDENTSASVRSVFENRAFSEGV